MAVTDQNILDVVTAEQATLTELQGVAAQLGTNLAIAITDIQGLPTGSPVQDSTLASLQATQQALQTVADALKGSSTNLDAVINPPAPEAPQA